MATVTVEIVRATHRTKQLRLSIVLSVITPVTQEGRQAIAAACQAAQVLRAGGDSDYTTDLKSAEVVEDLVEILAKAMEQEKGPAETQGPGESIGQNTAAPADNRIDQRGAQVKQTGGDDGSH